MARWQRQSSVEQLTSHLRDGVLRGEWRETMPGVHRLAAELGVNRKTVEAALQQLETQGLLESQGPGRRRRIVASANPVPPSLRVAILLGERADAHLHYIVELQHLLMEAGHSASLAPRSLLDLGGDVRRVARLVEKTGADAWVVLAGSREVLEWFAAQPVPAMALFGRRGGLPIPAVGPDKAPAHAAATRRLIDLGHQRVVMLARQGRLTAGVGRVEQAFLDELAAQDILTGPYNLPVWEDSAEEFHRLLDGLFRHTPPTALLIDEAFLFTAAQQHLARRGILAPDHVSLVCTDPDPTFAWCRPSVAHIHWDARLVVRRIVRWAANVARGEDDRRQSFTKAEFVEGGTVGSAPAAR